MNREKIPAIEWKRLLLELIVVFLGVTAGFLLNNWQMEKQDLRLEEKYMAGFRQDVHYNIDELKAAISSDSSWLQNAKSKLLPIRDGTITFDSANAIIKQIISISKINLQTGTYQDIINSGNLNIINNFKIKKQIVDYHVAISGVEFVDNYFYNYFSDIVMPYIFSNFSVLHGRIEDPKIIYSVQFANLIAGYFSMVQQRQSAYKEMLQKSYDLEGTLKPLHTLEE